MESKSLHLVVVLLSLTGTVLCLPLEKGVTPETFNRSLLENPNLYQGDILGPVPEDARFAVPSEYNLWSQRTIPYTIDRGVSRISGMISRAMKHIEAKTCIRFKPRTYERDYVTIFAGDSCYSMAGRQGGQQPLSLGSGCELEQIIVHELMHAIGFFHAHMRSDRDQYLTINWQNIHPDNRPQFALLRPHEGRIYTEFDYDSIMLYGETAFSHNNWSKTMVPKKSGVRLVDPHYKPGLSRGDVISINKLYKCM